MAPLSSLLVLCCRTCRPKLSVEQSLSAPLISHQQLDVSNPTFSRSPRSDSTSEKSQRSSLLDLPFHKIIHRSLSTAGGKLLTLEPRSGICPFTTRMGPFPPSVEFTVRRLREWDEYDLGPRRSCSWRRPGDPYIQRQLFNGAEGLLQQRRRHADPSSTRSAGYTNRIWEVCTSPLLIDFLCAHLVSDVEPDGQAWRARCDTEGYAFQGTPLLILRVSTLIVPLGDVTGRPESRM